MNKENNCPLCNIKMQVYQGRTTGEIEWKKYSQCRNKKCKKWGTVYKYKEE